jgi:hypothetical protein
MNNKLDTKYSFPYDTPWFIANGKEGDMLRINGFFLYQLGNFLKPLERIQGDTKLKDVSFAVWAARMWLEFF